MLSVEIDIHNHNIMTYNYDAVILSRTFVIFLYISQKFIKFCKTL